MAFPGEAKRSRQAEHGTAEHVAPGIAAIFRLAGFSRLWVLGGVVNALRWVEVLAAGLFTFGETRSGLAVALVLVARSLPLLCFGAMAGVLADSLDRKRMLFWGLVLSAAAAAAVCGLAAGGWVRPWHVAVAAFVSGTVWATELSVRRRMIGEIGGPGLVSKVIALDSLTNSLARIAGPLAGSLSFAAFGLEGAYLLSACCYLACALMVPGIRYNQVLRPLALAGLPRQLAEGFDYARRNPSVLTVLGVTATMNLFAFSYSAMVAPIVRLGFGVSDAMAGLLPAGEPLGALLGGLMLTVWTPRFDQRLLMMLGSAVFLGALTLLPLMPDFAAACLSLVLGGLGLAVFGNMQSSLILMHVPAALRSRQMGLITVSIGVSPLGQVLIGILSEGLGPLLAVTASASTGLLALGVIAVLQWKGPPAGR